MVSEVEEKPRSFYVWPMSTAGLMRPQKHDRWLGPDYRGAMRRRIQALSPGEAAVKFAAKNLATRVRRRMFTYVWVGDPRNPPAARFRVVVEMVPEITVVGVHPDVPW